MAHDVNRLIGEASFIEELAAREGLPPATVVGQGLAVIPLGHKQLDQLRGVPGGEDIEGFAYLSSNMRNTLCGHAGGVWLIYFETRYFGGIGGQAAAVFRNRDMTFAAALPVDEGRENPSPISQALALCGVKKGVSDFDEFDAAGLGERRSLEAYGLDEYEDDPD